MNIVETLDILLAFVAQWAGTTAPRIFAAFLGILCCLLTAVALWERRIKVLSGGFLLITGGFLVAVALHPGFLYFFATLNYLVRIRIVMIMLSFVVMVITLEAIRRSHLEERYAILWIATSLIILVTAFFPHILDFIRAIIGTDYVASVVGIIFIFLLLIAFHFSISLSTYRKNQTKIAQRCSMLEEQIFRLKQQIEDNSSDTHKIPRPETAVPLMVHAEKAPHEITQPTVGTQRWRGTQVAVPILIGAFTVAVFAVGIATPRPMVGDEVTHFFMLSKQAEDLSQPNFIAEIPTGWGRKEIRHYPHSFGWHYLGAIFYKVFDRNFIVVQIYQTLFWLQFLVAAFYLARERNGIENRSVLLYLVVLASLPVALIFSVTFYQDIPMTAQVMSAFCFLRRRRWLLSTLFICFAIGLKITALLFLPVFFLLMMIWQVQWKGWYQGIIRFSIASVITLSFTLMLGNAVERHSGSRFYPTQTLGRIIDHAKMKLFASEQRDDRVINANGREAVGTVQKGRNPGKLSVTPYEAKIIANHPGDLRKIENFFIYGGAIIWFVLFAGCASFLCNRFGMNCTLKEAGTPAWLFGIGLSYILLTAYFLRTAPDARFFLPGIPFILLPFAEKTVRLPKPKIIIAVITALAVLQTGYVLSKTFQLRNVAPEIEEAIDYLSENKPTPERIFMYPEGNYRLFPVQGYWYLDYKLREFWRADNDKRIDILRHLGIGAIVVKKYLVAEVGPKIINLGVYPTYFVKAIRGDSRFKNVFENGKIVIFSVPDMADQKQLSKIADQTIHSGMDDGTERLKKDD